MAHLHYQNLDGVGTRDELACLCNRRGLSGTAVEIGVHRGEFSHAFLVRWNGARFIGVDPWRPLDDYTDRLDYSDSQGDREADYLAASGAVAAHAGRGTLLRATSEEAAAQLPDGLDFVYIDGNHEYGHVKRDIALWWPKLREGGILAGHDYNNVVWRGVCQAVVDHAAAHRLPIWCIMDPMVSWYFVKEPAADPDEILAAAEQRTREAGQLTIRARVARYGAGEAPNCAAAAQALINAERHVRLERRYTP